ncbi:MAG: tRNA (adenosine(37)-N6)-dimethylallyltransferase MiaA [Dehalococcoidales bacterium]|nr:tRNA (adenosine(37)-N6)-dimethylallyltransferase MiaA [Dehalococcoidales bacterium]
MNRLVAIVGPTATGKSRLALYLAQQFQGEIVSADSRQVYRHMDIGTAKPGRQELSRVPHHLIDIINPDEDFSLAQYQRLAYQAINDIQQRQKLPVLVGGSGLYVWAVLEGWQIPEVASDPEFRRLLEEKAVSGGGEELYQELMKVDPVAAQSIDRRNVRRLIRALEVSRYAEAPFSRLHSKEAPPFDSLIIGLTTERAELYRRTDSRVDRMIGQGLVEEVKKLLDTGYGFDLPAMSGIGYKQIGMFLKGELGLDSAVRQIKTETHRLVRRQYNWFRLTDKRIHWFDIQEEMEAEIKAQVAGFIST